MLANVAAEIHFSCRSLRSRVWKLIDALHVRQNMTSTGEGVLG